jgi:asparagine synthetase B (glutamine-hydrolysing)
MQMPLNSNANVLPADRDTIRWNFPLFTDVSALPNLIRPPDLDADTRARNKARGSLFEVLVDQITLRLDDHPVYVQFSGGCDSSLVLSAAVTACARSSHDAPIPLTFRYPLLPETDENEYQRLMLDYLRIGHGRCEHITTEFDLLGHAAQRGLRELGLVWPAPVVACADVFRSIPSGLVLSGEGGDEVMGPRRIAGLFRAAEMFKQGRVKATAGNLAMALGPSGIRRRAMLKGGGMVGEWISPEEASRFVQRIGETYSREPLRRSRYAQHYARLSSSTLALHQITAIMNWAGQQYGAPLMDPSFVTAVDDLTPASDLRNRHRILRRHFTENLPVEITHRTDKRYMQSVYFNDEAREFARHWDGQIDDPYVRGPKLRSHWLTAKRDEVWSQTFLLLQAAWLAAVRR